MVRALKVDSNDVMLKGDIDDFYMAGEHEHLENVFVSSWRVLLGLWLEMPSISCFTINSSPTMHRLIPRDLPSYLAGVQRLGYGLQRQWRDMQHVYELLGRQGDPTDLVGDDQRWGQEEDLRGGA